MNVSLIQIAKEGILLDWVPDRMKKLSTIEASCHINDHIREMRARLYDSYGRLDFWWIFRHKVRLV